MRRYWIFEHDEEVWRKSHGYGFLALLDAVFGPLNIGGRFIGELQLQTDSKSRKAKKGQPVRFCLPRSSAVKHGVVVGDVTELLKNYGIRTRTITHDAKFFYFTVRGSQSTWAIEVIERWKAGQLGKSWAQQAADRRPPSLIDRLFKGVL